MIWDPMVFCSTQQDNRDRLRFGSANWKMPPTDESTKNLNRLISMIKWVEGPFVSTIQDDCNQSIGEVRLFDLLHDSKEYVSIPNSIVNDPILVKTFVDDRHELSVTFTVPRNAIEPVELRWVHFRGNLRIEPLGTGGNPLVMQPGESVKQYTRAGHLFVAMRLESTEGKLYRRSFCAQAT